MSEVIVDYLERSASALKAAHILYRENFFPDCVSKSYYAMFYAAKAALIREEIKVSKHSAVESEFGRHFVKTGKLDISLHRMYIRARGLREMADYDIDEQVLQRVAAQQLEDAQVFIEHITKWLSAENE